MTKPRILLDLDCTLADFVGGVARLWGLTAADLLRHWPPGEYPMNGPLAAALQAGNVSPQAAFPFRDGPMTDYVFWTAIENQPGFWTDLPELPWCRELLDLVRSKTDDWYVVTSPSRCPRCIPEKRAWLHRVLNTDWYDRLIQTPHKDLMAIRQGPTYTINGRCFTTFLPNVLIDDYDRNCDRFAAAGGTAVLLPAHHNRLHALAADPMKHVREQLENL